MHAIYIYIYIYTSAAGKFVNPSECSIFLHKYDSKHHDQVLKVDIENPIKQCETKIFSLSIIYSENDPVLRICV